MPKQPISRAQAFCTEYSLQMPILMAPMAGACPVSLAAAVANSGGMGACGALLMNPEGIAEWASEMRAASNGAFQINLWIPDPEPERDPVHEAMVRAFLAKWGPDVPEEAAEAALIDFIDQCEAIIEAGPAVVSSIMGLYPGDIVSRFKERNIKWFATATTVNEAIEAEQAGADVIVAQGMEAGGHRGAFKAEDAEHALIGLFSLLPAIVDAVNVPVVATGGISDARGVSAALMLGASAVQIGTGLLRTHEAGISPAWADAIGKTKPEETMATRAFSGRLGRSIKTSYVEAAASDLAPHPAPYPVQRGLTQNMRAQATKSDNLETMQAWAGQSAGLASSGSASEVLTGLWAETKELLGST